jgi:hypothetical protein
MKLVINGVRGGFAISKSAAKVMAEAGCERAKKELREYSERINTEGIPEYDRVFHGFGHVKGMPGGYPRDCVHLILAVETLRTVANRDAYSDLKVIEIPDGIEWAICEDFGKETVYEVARSWC